METLKQIAVTILYVVGSAPRWIMKNANTLHDSILRLYIVASNGVDFKCNIPSGGMVTAQGP